MALTPPPLATPPSGVSAHFEPETVIALFGAATWNLQAAPVAMEGGGSLESQPSQAQELLLDNLEAGPS
jgi:hypothetical protein